MRENSKKGERKKMYLVTAKQWSNEKQRQVTIVLGTFEYFEDAMDFKKWYSQKYSAQAKIIDGNDL